MTKENYIKYTAVIKKYIYENYKMMVREPDGIIKYPFIVPGSTYSNCLWDWDSWITNIAIRQIMLDLNKENDFIAYERGCILNFLDHTGDDGFMPILISPDEINVFGITGFSSNIHKPCIAQHAAFVIKSDGDGEWLREHFSKLEAFIDAYERNNKHENGLYFWTDDLAIGVDNDPCTFYRPRKSSASVYLNALMYKELLAVKYICEKLGYEEKAMLYGEKAEALASAIQDKLWDEKDGFYYSADLNLLPIDKNAVLHSGAPRHWDSLIQRIGVWSGILPMWAGLATKEQAERIVRENYLDKRTFFAPYGIRTLSKLEKMYTIAKTGNPSCWLGPVWGISNYFTFRALVRYGFKDEAEDLAYKCIELYGKDIEKCGEMHEYYHPDTGEGVNNPGFQNWNFLVLNMIAYLENRPVVEEF